MNYCARTSGTVLALGLTLVTLTTRPAGAQQFSADVISTPATGSTTTRVYVGKTQMRLQTFSGGQPKDGMIWDAGRKSVTIVMDENHSYIGGNSTLLNAAMSSSGAPVLVRIFRPTSGSDPCVDWNAAVLPYADSTKPRPHFSCHSVGEDAVNGRTATKWFVVSTQGAKTDSGYAWIDSRLRVVSKSQDRNGSVELKNIQEGAQPDTEFQVPAGYRQVDASALLTRLNGNTSTIANMFGSAVKDIGAEAATETTNEAKQKAADGVKKKIKSVFHFP